MQGKREALIKLDNAISNNKVDKDILSLLKVINSSKDFYTTSSCSGRIILIELDEIGDKEGARILGKWHANINVENIIKSFNKYDKKSNVYFMVQSPIFHIVGGNLKKGLELCKIGLKSSFKYSNIKSIDKKDKVMVEILSSEQINVPIASNGIFFPSEDYLEFLVEEANLTLTKAKEKLVKLSENITGFLS